MIEALLVDLGGVLLDAQPRRAMVALARLSGRPAAELEAAILTAVKDRFDRGQLGEAAFLDELRRACGRPLGDSELRAAWCAIFDDLPEMQALTARLAARHPTYLLSNTDPVHFAWARAHLPLLDRFRGFHLSYEAGALKPEAEYYRQAFRRFALEPAACVLVDDRPENVEAMVSLGGAGIVHESAAGTEAALRALGIRA
ncbi:MAG TPA: HAD-IA family hydrolase [Myxococcales bacterium]|nr:HAD-IA family hydrolase [Myxococcales bacterium]